MLTEKPCHEATTEPLPTGSGGRKVGFYMPVLAAACLLLAACTGDDNAPALAGLAPSGAERLQERGSWDVAAATINLDLIADVRRIKGPVDTIRWKLPADLTFADACASVRQALGNGWKPMKRLSEQGTDARRCGWRHPRIMGPDRVFALAWGEVPVRVSEGGTPVRLAVTAFTQGHQ